MELYNNGYNNSLFFLFAQVLGGTVFAERSVSVTCDEFRKMLEELLTKTDKLINTSVSNHNNPASDEFKNRFQSMQQPAKYLKPFLKRSKSPDRSDSQSE